jgi:transposase
MTKHTITFIGLDTHKEFSEVVTINDHRDEGHIALGRIPSTRQAFTKLARRLQSQHPNSTLHFVYEAGPCGFWIYRLLTTLGHVCYVVAPSMIPKKPGERIKTDKRDAIKLARLMRANELSPIYVPEADDEAVRDLSRAREAACHDRKRAKHQIKSFLLRNFIMYQGSANWDPKHRRWLAEIVLPHPAQQIVLQEMVHTLNERTQRLNNLDNELAHIGSQWRFFPVVKAIQAMRGVSLIVAMGLICELGDLTRFDHPSKLMAYIGLVPSEHTSSDKRRLGAITKMGNTRARRLLVEGAHSYRYQPKVSVEMEKRQEGLPQEIKDIAWQAQLRLCWRYQRLMYRGKHRNIVVVATAREMVGYLWEIIQLVPLEPVKPAERVTRVPR